MDNFGAQEGASRGVPAGRHDPQLGGSAAGVVLRLQQPRHRALVRACRAICRMDLKAALLERLPVHSACPGTQ